MVSNLIERQVLVHVSDILHHLRGSHVHDACKPISAVGIVTRDRRTALRRCVDSAKAILHEGRTLLVVESSPSHETINGASGGQASHSPRRRLIEFLSEQGIDRKTIEFGLTGWPEAAIDTGANRNTLLLLTAGDFMLSIDDDILVSPVLALRNNPSESVLITARDAREFTFGETTPYLTERFTDCDRCLVSALSQLLGQTVGTIIGSHDNVRLDPAITTDGIFPIIRTGASLRVIAALPGLVGDSGMGWPTGLVLQRAEILRQLTASPAIYRHAIEKRQCARTVQQRSISVGDSFMSSCFAYANDQSRVPFSPNFRFQDGLFGAMLRSAHPNGCIGYVPETVQHQPINERSYDRSLVTKPAPISMCRVLLGIIHNLRTHTTTSMSDDLWCSFAATALEDISSARGPEFSDFLYHTAYVHWTNLDGRLCEVLETDGWPAWFRKDIVTLRANIHRCLRTPQESVPKDIPRIDGEGEIATCKRYLFDFAQLLRAWPKMWRACQALAEKDRHALIEHPTHDDCN